MHDYVVVGYTECRREVVIAFEGRPSAIVPNHLFCCPVDIVAGHSRPKDTPDVCKRFRHQQTSLTNQFNLIVCFVEDFFTVSLT